MVGSTNFPSSLDSHTGASPLGFGEVNNQAYTKATASHTNSVTTITVASTALFPSKGFIVVKREIISYTGTTATTFTGCTRAVGGTTAAAFLSGTLVEQVVVAANHNDLAAAVVAVETAMGAYGNAVGLGDPIINGHFNVWQENTSFTSVASGTWTADQWIYSKSGAVVHDVLRTADVPSVATNAPLGNYCLHLDVTTVDSSIAAGDYSAIATRIEGFNFLPFAQRAFVLSFWVKAAKTGTHCVYFKNSGNDRSYVAEYTVSVADTWEWKSVAVSASPSAGTWAYTTGRGLEIGWTQACGSTYQTTAGAWQTGDYKGTSSQVNETDSTSNNFKLYGVRMNLGTLALTGAPRPHGLERLLCQRYYEQSYNDGTAPGSVTTAGEIIDSASNAIAGSTSGFIYRPRPPVFAATKRATPTIVLYAISPATANAVQVASVNTRSGAAASSPSVSQPWDQIGFDNTSAQAIASGDIIQFQWTAAARIP